MDTKVLLKLERLLKRFPETWVHTREIETIGDGGATRTFHHVDYKSHVEGRPKVRLVSHVSSDMCELLVSLKANAPDLIAVARASPATNVNSMEPFKVRKTNRRRPNA